MRMKRREVIVRMTRSGEDEEEGSDSENEEEGSGEDEEEGRDSQDEEGGDENDLTEDNVDSDHMLLG